MKKILLTMLILGSFIACSNGSKGGGGGGGGNLSSSPAILDFGNVEKGNRSDVMGITIQNNGSADATINSFTVSDPFMKDSGSTCNIGTVLKTGESCIVGIAVMSGAIGEIVGSLTVNTSAGSFQTPLKVLITVEERGKFVTVTDYPAYNARFAVTTEGTIYAVNDNLLVLSYDKIAKSWSPVAVTNDVLSGFGLEDYSVSAVGGKIYVIGGLKNGVTSNGVLEFNPANGEWKDITPSNYDYRSILHTATTVNGKIYVIGGIGVFAETGPLEITDFTGVIDPVAGTYKLLPSGGFPARSEHAAATIDNKIYVFGGINGANAYLNGVYAFDTVTESWSTVLADGDTQLNISPQGGAAMTSAGNNLYVFGGSGDSGTFGDFKKFSLNTPGWTDFLTSLDPIVKPTEGATIVYNANNIYAFGGIGGGEFKKAFWRYNMELATFDNLTRIGILTPLRNSASVAVGADVYLLGGEKDLGFSEEFTKFNLFERTGSDINPESMIIAPFSGISTATDGQFIYMFGGKDAADNAKDDLLIYNIAERRYERPEPTSVRPSPRFGAASAVVNGKLYVIGGSDDTDPLDDTWVYDQSINTWDDITGASTVERIAPLTLHSATVIGTKIYVIGGLTIGNHAHKRIYVMDTSKTPLIWEDVRGGDIPNVRFSHSAAAIGENIYVFSGKGNISGDVYLNDLWKYDTVAKNWTQEIKPNMPYSYDSGYKIYNENGTLWFLNNYKYDLRRYRP